MKRWIFFLALTLYTTAASAQFQADDLSVNGYVQGLPLRIAAELPEPLGDQTFWEYRLQNRLNVHWYASPTITIQAEMRTRFFAGDLVKEIPGYAEAIDTDDGIVNLSLMVAEKETWFLHYMPDRLNLDWTTNDWRITAGRQRINWGINTVSNPNDLFNIYSFYDFDYPERPGTDAIRIQHFLDWASRIEVAFSPTRDMKDAVAAGLYGFNTSGYDVQLITGYFKNRWAAGGGWAGSIKQAGFKGELMLFTDLEKQANGGLGTNLVAGLSADYMFGNSLYLVVEGLYNQVGGRDSFFLLGEEFSPDNPSFSRFQFTTQGTYPFSPIVSGTLAMIYYPDEQAVFVSPSLNVSVLQDLNLNVFTQLFMGSSDSVFANAGNVAAASLRWNF